MYHFDFKDFNLLGDRILVEKDPPPPVTIIRPNMEEKEIITARVIAIGDKVNKGLLKGNKELKCSKCSATLNDFICWDCGEKSDLPNISQIRVGSRVFFSGWIQGANFEVNSKKYVLLSRDQVIGVMDEEKRYY